MVNNSDAYVHCRKQRNFRVYSIGAFIFVTLNVSIVADEDCGFVFFRKKPKVEHAAEKPVPAVRILTVGQVDVWSHVSHPG